MEKNPENTLNTVQEVVLKVRDTYPFLDKKEMENFLYNATIIDSDENSDNVKKIDSILKLLNNPHAGIYEGKEMILPVEWRHGDLKTEKPFFEVLENIMYLKIPSLINIDYKDLETPFLENAENTEGLIIDLRYNGGGQEYPARTFITQYLSKPGDHLMGINFTRDIGMSINKDEIYVKGTNTPYEKSIAVLVNDETFSSAERFVSVIKASTDCVIIGTKTKGGSGNPKEYEFYEKDQKYYIWIPTWRFFLPGKDKPLEETKIEPDITYDKEDIIDFSIKYIKSKTNERSEK